MNLAREWWCLKLWKGLIIDNRKSDLCQKDKEVLMMISSVKVEKFEPFGKAFCSRHPFAALPKTSNKRSILESEIKPVSQPISPKAPIERLLKREMNDGLRWCGSLAWRSTQ